MSESVRIVIDEVTHPSQVMHPCQYGNHLWAWLTSGGMGCVSCKARR